MSKFILFIFILLPICTVSAQDIYKWVDETGKVHYSDQPLQGQGAIVGSYKTDASKADKKKQELAIRDEKDIEDRFKLKLKSFLKIYYCDGESIGQRTDLIKDPYSKGLRIMSYEREGSEKVREQVALKEQLKNSMLRLDSAFQNEREEVTKIVNFLTVQIALQQCYIDYNAEQIRILNAGAY
ncbi:hypothetical protein GCM10007978_17070 [Shewanella hanedai]|uniref:DUF4124 domain-containing protein n=1 Tax=Shewanella hanedai TaxID=25 RepID=UPI00163DD976|nr:DUF4124 domain-containing protein [Shewanella hanedai]GGI79839.1 hypothetical protein GCM10007978_17070 [Shewanella hanedai]